jgi:hypothetical protein
LVVVLSFPLFAANTEEMKETKSGIASGLLAATVVAAVGGTIAQAPCFKNTGLDVGIGASSILGSLSVLFEGKKAEALRSMAFTAPVLAGIGAIFNHEKVMEVLAKYGQFGIGSLAQSAIDDPSKKAAFAALTVVGTYIAIQKPLEKLSQNLSQKGAEIINYIAKAIN